MHGGCFPSALEGTHNAFHHLVTATLSSALINKKIQLLYSCPHGAQQEKELWHTWPSCESQEEQPTTLRSPSNLLEAPRQDAWLMHGAFHPSHLATGSP